MSGDAHELAQASPAARLLGHRLLQVDEAAAALEAEYQAQAELFNPMGVMQGGFTAAMLEQTLYDAAVAFSEGGAQVTLLEQQCHFLTAVGPGTVRCRAQVVRRGRSTIFVEGWLYDCDGQMAATANGVAAVARDSGS